MVRAGLELAFEVARLGSMATPPVAAPRSLQPFLRFARLPDRALAPVRRALEDEEFRARVAAVAAVPGAAEQLDPASTLFLTRPDGWAEELATLTEVARAAAAAHGEARADKAAIRRAERAEAAARRAAEGVERARQDAARLEAAVADERRLRRAAEQERSAAQRAAAAAEDRAGTATAEVAELRERVASMTVERDLLAARLAGTRSAMPAFPDPAPAAAAVAAARSAADGLIAALGRALDEASAALVVPVPRRPPVGTEAPGTPEAPRSPASGETAAPAEPRARSTGRRPLPIPPAIFDDSPEAAAHLVRAPGALLLVDGYNAAMTIWPGVDVTEMRLRLTDALGELAARTGVRAHVVFDGAELFGGTPSPASHRTGLVRVSFSAPDVEADDVILELVGTLPAARPVLVASSDRRVQDGARRLGANVISSAQLAAVLGR